MTARENIIAENLISEKEVAKRTSTSARTWQGYRMRGCGPKFIRLSGRCVRYRWSDVATWLDSCARTPTIEQGGV